MMTNWPRNCLSVHVNRRDVDSARCKFRPQVECDVLNVYTNANHDPTTNAEPTLTLSLTLIINLIVNLSIAKHDCTDHVQPGFLTRGYVMNDVLIIHPISTRLLRACVRRRPAGCCCGRSYLNCRLHLCERIAASGYLSAGCPSFSSPIFT